MKGLTRFSIVTVLACIGGIGHAHLWINVGSEENIVRDASFPPPGARNVWLSVVFDSTHFADGSTIVAKMEAWDNLGNYMADDGTAPAYNKAFVFGNNAFYEGTLINGGGAVDAATAFAGANHTIRPGTAAGPDKPFSATQE